MSTSNLEKEYICRTCLSTSNLKPLFPDLEVNSTDIMHNIVLATGLEIKVNDGLPQNICYECSESVKAAVCFRQLCQNTDVKLRQIFIRTDISIGCSNSKEIAEPQIVTCLIEDNIANNVDSRKELESENRDHSKEYESSIPSQFMYEKSSDDANSHSVCNTKENKLISYDRKRYMELIDGPVVPKQPILCKICKKYSKCLNSFEKHAMSHLGYNILCEFCGKSCISTANLLRHQRRKHGLAKDNSFPCSACGFQAIEREQLEVHERRVHTKERPFICTDCGAAFFSKRVLDQHKANHKTDKPFQCDICPLKFKLRCRLTKHIHRVHTKNYCKYTYICYLCDKRYSRTHHVRKHVFKIHGIPLKQQRQVQRCKIESTFNVSGSSCITPNTSSLRGIEGNFHGSNMIV